MCSWHERKSMMTGRARRHSIVARKAARKRRLKHQVKNYLKRFARRRTKAQAVYIGAEFLMSSYGVPPGMAQIVASEVVGELSHFFQ